MAKIIPQLISLDDSESKLYTDIKTLREFKNDYSFYVHYDIDVFNKYDTIDKLLIFNRELIKIIVEYNYEIIMLQYTVDISADNYLEIRIQSNELDLQILHMSHPSIGLDIQFYADKYDFIYTIENIIDKKCIKDEYNNDFNNFINVYVQNRYGISIRNHNRNFLLEYTYESPNVISSCLKRRTVNHNNLTALCLFIKKLLDAIELRLTK
jgi:hypothetical protein